VENFWKEIYEKNVQYNEAACWIKERYPQNPGMEWNPLCEKDVAEALRVNTKLESPWKRPNTKLLA
jgi:hypothetical protein